MCQLLRSQNYSHSSPLHDSTLQTYLQIQKRGGYIGKDCGPPLSVVRTLENRAYSMPFSVPSVLLLLPFQGQHVIQSKKLPICVASRFTLSTPLVLHQLTTRWSS